MERLDHSLHHIAGGAPIADLAINAMRISSGICTVIDIARLYMEMGRRIGESAYALTHPDATGKMIYYAGDH